jgi:hypothetical protein
MSCTCANKHTHVFRCKPPDMRTALNKQLKTQTHTQVSRYHPPNVRTAINELLVAKERLALEASAAWGSFLKNDFGSQHYAQLKVRALPVQLLCLPVLYMEDSLQADTLSYIHTITHLLDLQTGRSHCPVPLGCPIRACCRLQDSGILPALLCRPCWQPPLKAGHQGWAAPDAGGFSTLLADEPLSAWWRVSVQA